MVAGMPKAGKSNWAMWWVAEMNLPTLYFSADMSQHTATTRLASWATGHTVQTVEDGLSGPGLDFYTDALQRSRIQWCFDSSPATEDIMEELDAYVEAHDAWPQVIVIDNLMNVQASEEFAGQQFIMSELHSLARLTGATVIVLHHCSEAGQSDVTLPPPRKAIMNKVSQLPEIVFTVALDPASSQFRVACVANRSGKGDATGKSYITLRSEVERCQFHYWIPQAYAWQPGD